MQRNLNFASAIARPKPTPSRANEIGVAGKGRFGGKLQESDYNPDWSNEQRYKKIERMLNDDDVGAAMDAITMPLEAATWEIAPGDDSSAARDAADLVRADLIDMPRVHTWDYILDHALSAVAWGSMFFESVWEIGDQVRLRKLAPRLPQTLREFHVSRDGTLTKVEQWISGDEAGVIEIPASKLVPVVYRQQGNDYRGRSLLRRAYRAWWMRQQLEDVDAIAAEKHGMGVDVGKVPGTAKDDEVQAFKAALRALHVHQMQHLSLPEGFDYSILAPSGTVHDVMKSVKHHQQKVLRTLLADFLGMGEGRLGSHGLSEDKSSMFMLKLVKLGRMITNAFNCHLIEPWHRWNFGPDVAPPKLRHGRLDTRNLEAFANAVGRGIDSGALTPDMTVEREFREIAGMAPVDPGERDAAQRARREAGQAETARPFGGRERATDRPRVSARLSGWRASRTDTPT